MQKTRISAFPTIKLAFLGVFIAVVLLPTTIDYADAAGCGDFDRPVATITYLENGPYQKGEIIRIVAEFNEKLAGQPRPHISFEKQHGWDSSYFSSPVEMKKEGKRYFYDYIVNENANQLVRIHLSKATDNSCNKNPIVTTPISGETFNLIKFDTNKPAPKFTSSSITATGGPNGGFGGILNSLDDDKREIHKDDFVTLRLDLDENFGKFHTQNLYFGEIDNVVSMSSDYLVHVKYHNGQIEIDDPTEFFSEFKVMSTSFDGKEILFFDLKPARPYHEMDVGIYSWNENHQFVREMTKNAFSIVEKIKTAEPGSIEIGNIEMKKIENYKGVMQKQVSSNEHFEPFLIEQKSNAFFEIESQEIIPKLEAKYTQWSEGMISDKEFVEFLAFGIKQKLQDVDSQDPTHSELSNLLSWSTLISNTLEDKNSEKTSMVIDGAYQYMRASLE